MGQREHLIETNDPAALAEHAAEWADVLELEIYPVIEDAEAGTAAKKSSADSTGTK